MKRATVFALVGVVFAAALALTAALEGCYRCDGPGYPACPDVQPDYPPLNRARDAGRE